MSKTQSQRGFGAIGAVVVVLVVAVVAFAGWYVWQKNKNDNKPTNQTTQNQDNKPDEQKPADPTDGGKYLVISEWGVRFPLSEQFRGDVKYKLSSPDPDGSQSALFEVGKIAALPGSRCTFTQGSGIGIALARLVEEPSAAEKQGYGEENIHHFGSYWYQETFVKAACAATDADEQNAGDTRATLGRLMQQLEVIPQN